MNENFDKIYEELSTQIKQFNIEKLPITKQISENIKDEINKIDIKSYIIYIIPILCLFGLISLFKNSNIDGENEEIGTEKKSVMYNNNPKKYNLGGENKEIGTEKKSVMYNNNPKKYNIDGENKEIGTEKKSVMYNNNPKKYNIYKYNIYKYIFVCVIIFIGIYYFLQNLYVKKKINRPIFFM